MLVSCRQWRQVASAWNPESARKPHVPIQNRKQYLHLLLAFEIQLKEGAPSHLITKDVPAEKAKKAAKHAAVTEGNSPLPASKVALPLPDVSRVPLPAVLSLQKPVASAMVGLLVACAEL